MDLRSHNEAQKEYLQSLEDREIYYYGIEIGHDPRNSQSDMEVVRLRVANIIISGYGGYLAEIITGHK
jgi:hypothetical protein